jgi:bifunctional polynucleotide phosphatase/kinase
MSNTIVSRVNEPCALVAAFDLDHTLLKPKGTRKFPKNKDDAEYAFPGVHERLLELRQRGYKIVIFTNQSGRRFDMNDMIYKVDNWLGKPTDIYVSVQKDHNRKPCTGMYDLFLENNGTPTDVYYVGDAAGRPTDFSDSDLKFAHNAGIPFFTPEKYFLDDPRGDVPVKNPLEDVVPQPFNEQVPKGTLILQVGPPACGKSTLSRSLIHTYGGVLGNNDTTGSSRKTLKLVKEAFETGEPLIIVDNTNPSMKSREPYVSLARKHGYQVWAVVNNLPLTACHFLNRYRSQTKRMKWIPDIAYHMFRKNFQYPEEPECDRIFDYVPQITLNNGMLF